MDEDMCHYVSKIPREMTLSSPSKVEFAKSHPEHLVKLYHRAEAGQSSPLHFKLFKDPHHRVWKVRARDSASCPIETRDMHGRRIITNMQLDSPLLSTSACGQPKATRNHSLSGYSRDWAFTDQRTGPSIFQGVSKNYPPDH